MSLRVSHDRAITDPQLERLVSGIELRRSTEERWREEPKQVFPLHQRSKKEPRRVRAEARSEQVIDLYNHDIENDEISAERRDERRRKLVALVPSVSCSDKGARVGDDPQRAAIGSRRYRSASRPRSGGPSPDATYRGAFLGPLAPCWMRRAAAAENDSPS
jgi:hypothetical protein